MPLRAKRPCVKTFLQKRTRFIGNLPGLSGLSCVCQNDHLHQHVEDSVMVDGRSIKRSVLAGSYPDSLCKEIAKLVDLAQTLGHAARRRRVSRRLP
jgi:hypothetical protein